MLSTYPNLPNQNLLGEEGWETICESSQDIDPQILIYITVCSINGSNHFGKQLGIAS